MLCNCTTFFKLHKFSHFCAARASEIQHQFVDCLFEIFKPKFDVFLIDVVETFAEFHKKKE